MLKSSFIDSNDYYPVSVCNEFVNIEKRDEPIQTNDYNLNKDISRSVNNNENIYNVYQDPTVPSQSLYIESDRQFSDYYNSKKKDQIEYFTASNIPPITVAGDTVSTPNVFIGILVLLLIILIPLLVSFVLRNKEQ